MSTVIRGSFSVLRQFPRSPYCTLERFQACYRDEMLLGPEVSSMACTVYNTTGMMSRYADPLAARPSVLQFQSLLRP
jgi:hypothetical protein